MKPKEYGMQGMGIKRERKKKKKIQEKGKRQSLKKNTNNFCLLVILDYH
jgi:hypothetical protein